MSTTLLDMRTRVRHRANMEESEFVGNIELNQYINSSYQELYDILVTTFEDYYTLPPVTFTLTTLLPYYTLPSDFYKLRGVDAASSGTNYYSLLPFNFINRNDNDNVVNNFATRYRIVGSRLYITPEDTSAGNYRLWYVPIATILSSDISTLDGINGWEEYVVVDAARKCLAKEESDTRSLVAEKAELKQRIINSASKRDSGMTKTISDVSSIYRNGF